MSKVKVTVYISSHNYGRYLKEAIESVIRQTASSWELILINENSDDNTQDIFDLYKGDIRVKIFNTKRLGIPSAANFALEKSSGEYFIRLDADDIFEDNNLLVLSNYLDHNSDIAMVFPDYYLMDENANVFSQVRRQPFYHKNHQKDVPPNGASIMIRSDVLKKIGGYRTDLGAQDGTDLWSKIINNHKYANVSLPLFYYRRHENNVTNNNKNIINARRRIKADLSGINIEKFKPIIAVIPCRKNYDFISNLWKVELSNGKSLLEITIEKCINSKIFEHIIIASDTNEVKNTIKKFKDNRLEFFERDTQSTILSKPIAHTLDDITSKYDKSYSGITYLGVLQAPFVDTATIEEGINSLIMNDVESTILVEEINTPVFQRTSHGMNQINKNEYIIDDFDTLYSHTRTCVVTRNRNLKKGSLTGSNIISNIAFDKEAFLIKDSRDIAIANLIIDEKKIN